MTADTEMALRAAADEIEASAGGLNAAGTLYVNALGREPHEASGYTEAIRQAAAVCRRLAESGVTQAPEFCRERRPVNPNPPPGPPAPPQSCWLPRGHLGDHDYRIPGYA